MSETQINGTMLQGFTWNLPADGQHWRRLGQMADRLVSEGITSVWMPPAYKGQGGINDVGYGVYDLWDLGEFDQRGDIPTKYGTRKEYAAAIVALQQAGLDVIADIVLNHKLGADETEKVKAREVAADNRLYDMSDLEEITAWTKFTFPGRAGELDDFEWDWHCFKGVDYDAATDRNGIWLFKDKAWDSDVGHENGNFDYLMGVDVDVNDEKVYKQLCKWGVWYLEQTGVDGIRLDALKHISKSFYRRWLADMRKKLGRELFCVGEYWLGSAGDLVDYLGEEKVMSMFDVPLHFAFFHASVDREHIDFAHMLDGAFVTVDPVHAVTFVDNHDTQPNQSLESTVQSWFKPVAYSIILLREAGYPCVFFADLFGLPNDAIPAVPELPLLMEVRRRFAYGPQHDSLDEADLVGWTREGDASTEFEDSGCAVVLCTREPQPEPEEPEQTPEELEDAEVADDSDQAAADEAASDKASEDGEASDENADGASDEGVEDTSDEEPEPEPVPTYPPCKELYVGTQHAGETWRCVLGDVASCEIGPDGVGRFPASASSVVAVYLPEGAAAKLDHIPIVMPR